jgi:hypothetical protein
MQALREFRIGEGGLLRRCEKAARLTTLRRQIVTAISVTWVPVVALGLINERSTGLRDPLIHTASLHVRLLVAIPLLLTLDQVFPRVCRGTLQQLVSQSFVPAAAQERFDRMLRKVTLVADSFVPELLLAFLAFGMGLAAVLDLLPATGLARRGPLTAARVWYGLANWPVLQFLLWRSLWRWVIWVRVLIGLCRIDLDLVAAHPDQCGGISFLRIPSIGYCATLLFAISAVLCSDQARRLEDVTLASLAPFLIVFITAGALLAFGPLLLFSPRLLRLRREGRVQYAGLGVAYGRSFHRQWIASGEPADRLAGSATQPLADLGGIYRETIDRLHPLLFDKRDLIVLLVATLLPMVPIMLWHVPRHDWEKLIGLLTGRSLR